VIVPVRAAPLFAAVLKVTDPLPVPDAPAVTASQSPLFDAAVHVHDGVLAVTATAPLPPDDSTDCDAGEIEYVHDGGGGGGAPACVTVNVWPETEIVPLRAAPVLAAALKPTLPLPLPEAPLVTVIHAAPADAVHVHQLPDATVNDPLPPALSIDWPAGDRAKLQPAAACVTLNVCPAIVAVPVRSAPPLAAMLNPMLPDPVADGMLVNVIQLALDVAVHVHALPVVTVIDPVWPAAGAASVVGPMAYEHGVGVGDAASA